MKSLILGVLIAGSVCISAIAAPDINKWSDDEVGERWVGRIKDTLKDSFMTLLATSEFATKAELRRRVDSANDALKRFSGLVEGEIVPQPDKSAVIPAPVTTPAPAQPLPETPAPVEVVLPAPAPAPEVIPASSPAFISGPAFPADGLQTAAATPAPAAEQAPVPVDQTPSSDVSTLPIAPEAATPQPVVVADNSDLDDQDPFDMGVAEKFDTLAVAELSESAQELIGFPHHYQVEASNDDSENESNALKVAESGTMEDDEMELMNDINLQEHEA